MNPVSALLPASTDLTKAVVIVRRQNAQERPLFLVELQPHQTTLRNGNLVPLPAKVEWAHHPRICFWGDRGAQHVVAWLYQTGLVPAHEPIYIEALLRHIAAEPTEALPLAEAALIMGLDPATPQKPDIPREPETVEEALRMLENDPTTPKLPEEFRHDPHA